MKTGQLLAIALICGVGVIAGWSILQTRPPNPRQEQREEKKAGGDKDKDTGLGKVQLAKEMVERSGIILEEAAPRKLQRTIKVNGQITANKDRMAYVIPRFPCIAKAVRKKLGDKVQEGEVLATIQSSESLQNYDVKSEVAGTIIAGWRILAEKPPQPSLEIAEREPSSSPKDKDEDGDKGVTAKALKEPSSGPKDKDEREVGEKNIKEKDLKEPNEVGRIDLNEKKVENANLDVSLAGPAKIKATIQLYGKIALNEDTVANVTPRYPGVVKAVYKRLGDRVQKGEELALIESNDSLRDYQVVSEIYGTIIKKEVTVGEVVRDDRPIFTVADLSTVWVDFSVFPQDFRRLKEGQVVQINYADNIMATTGKITYIAPFGSENTQSMLARAVVQNPDGLFRPGLFVTAELQFGEIDVPVAVRPAAIQSVNEKTVVFVVKGSAFEAREVELGTRDESYVEVMSGLNAGDRYVAGNSFLLKAELGKGEVQDSD